MFGWLKKKPAATQYPLAALRETLFGDLPLQEWGAKGGGAEPWNHFAAASARLQGGDRAGARESLEHVLAIPGLESRQYLQAWNALGSLGVAPPADQAKRLYGVVIDVPVNQGLDTVAGYEDHSARYLNFSGAPIIWDAPGTAMDAHVDALLDAGRTLVQQIGPWEGPRPPLPPGMARISLLTPSGLHFGQAPFQAFTGDPMAAPVIGAAMQLMQALIHEAQSRG
ncbi:MAG TPA: hypothetical protein VFY65_07845 [Longimicrobium sp.]|nr:hypothetical protein [Longimicrobium sp.]